MKFDFDKMSGLAQTDPAEFERQRASIIETHMLSLPSEQQATARALQAELDAIRGVVPPDKFLEYINTRLQGNLETIKQSLEKVNKLAQEDPAITEPISNEIKSIAVFTNKKFTLNQK